MRVKIPPKIKISTHTYSVVFDPHLRHDDGCYGVANHRKQTVNIESSIPPTLRDQTFLHEVVHIIDKVFVCRMNEDDLERMSNGFADLLFNNLGIELDWSDIEGK